MKLEHAPNAQKKLDAAMRRFGLGVSAASQNLADTILTLPNAPVVSDDGAELRAALANFEVAFKSVLSVLHKTLRGGRDVR